ncbi:hypothetical protein PybrP1_008902, partial [[Pythium] brassicae (nom. inval.)]
MATGSERRPALWVVRRRAGGMGPLSVPTCSAHCEVAGPHPETVWAHRTSMAAPLATLELITRATAGVRGLSARGALRVWHALGSYVAAQLVERRCVRIAGFGVFALGAARDPVFLHSADFLRANRVRERRHMTIGDATAPIAAVNMSAVAQHHLPGCSKDLVASVVSSVLALAGSLAKQGHALRLSWLPLGEWQCDGDTVAFTFLTEFQAQLTLVGRTAGAVKVGQGVLTTPTADTPVTLYRRNDKSSFVRVVEPRARVLSAAALQAHTKTAATVAALARSAAPQSTDHGSRAFVGTHSSFQKRSLVRASSQQQSAPRALTANTSRASTQVTTASTESSRLNSLEQPRARLASRDASKRSTRTAPGDRSSRTAPPSESASAQSKAAASTRAASTTKTATPPPSQAWTELSSRTTTTKRATVDELTCSVALISRAQDAEVVVRVKNKLVERCGENGLNALQQVLLAMDSSGDGLLSPKELRFGLRDLGLEFTASDLSLLVAALDRNRDGSVDLHELLVALRGAPLAGPRLALVRRAFALMDTGGSGVVSADDIRDNYDVSLIPAVRARQKSKQQALEFLRHWQEICDGSGTDGIRFEAFLEYYQ